MLKESASRRHVQLGTIILFCIAVYVGLSLTLSQKQTSITKRLDRGGHSNENTKDKLANLNIGQEEIADIAIHVEGRANNLFNEGIKLNLSINIHNVDELQRLIRETVNKILIHPKHLNDSFFLPAQREQSIKNTDVALGNSELDFKDVNMNGKANVTRKRKSLLTLFTTWGDNPALNTVHTNTLKNWASFRPALTPVLFTEQPEMMEKARSFGWLTFNASKTIKGLPVLKNMFQDVMQAVESEFYGYSNGDIIFDSGLLKTFVMLKYNLNISVDTEPVLITGQRWNVLNVTKHEAYTQQNLTNLAKRRGALFQSSAEDFFFSNSIYPWSTIPELVVGALGYDNWLVLNARNKQHHVVDITQSVTAIHQSVTDNPYLSHWKDMANYNNNLLKSIYKSDIPWPRGFTDCINWYTKNKLDTVVLNHRLSPAFCY